MVYLDHAATTPLVEPVREAMQPFLNEKYGNSASLHHMGEEAHDAVEAARETVADAINAEPEDVIFTSGATESINTVLKGVVNMFGAARTRLATTRIEHKATVNTCKFLEGNGVDVVYANVDRNGFVTPGEWREVVAPGMKLASVIWGNNEIGTLQDMEMISSVCEERSVPLHVDATQVIGKTGVDVEKYGVDALSASAHKFHGPKGTGFLYLDKNLQDAITPLLHGGSQEFGERAGTVNVAGVVGMAAAIEYVEENRASLVEQVQELMKRFHGEMERFDCFLNGAEDFTRRVPGHLHYTFPERNGMMLLKALSREDVYVSTGSACLTGDPSHVLQAIGLDRDQHEQVLRFTFGVENEASDVEHVVDALETVLT